MSQRKNCLGSIQKHEARGHAFAIAVETIAASWRAAKIRTAARSGGRPMGLQHCVIAHAITLLTDGE